MPTAKTGATRKTQQRKPAAAAPSDQTKPEKLTLEDCVRGFLSIVVSHPEKEPKTQRAQRENSMMILGFNQAQEQLRHILETHGRTPKVRAIAEVREKGQQKPSMMGRTRIWLVP